MIRTDLHQTLLLCAVMSFARTASAHPVLQGSLDLTVGDDAVVARARITLEEIIVSDTIDPEPRPETAPADAKDHLAQLARRHGNYLAQHLSMSADGKLLTGAAIDVASTTEAATQPLGPDQQHVVIELRFPLKTPQPKQIQIWQDVFGTPDAPQGGGGGGWQASYVTSIRVRGGPVTQGLLLASAGPIDYECDWSIGTTTTPETAQTSTHHWPLFRAYVAHGVRHILTGYDHLLFISALVLAAARFWDLVKVVTAFTLAHTVTLTLATLHIVRLPEWVVEPMIAASIVFVAAQNIFWPKQSRGWSRLAIAFAFGLFHGLAFAGGLLDAMGEMSGVTVGVAIIAFSLGVELGHQFVVLPLFAALKLIRHGRSEPDQHDHVLRLTRRYGSAAICVAGAYYLVVALSSAIAVGGKL
jgi:hydrogenase/urease accessory protein HupE